jgi:hypothetical protein
MPTRETVPKPTRRFSKKGWDGLPGTVRRSLEILRRFDPALDPVAQVKLVLHTEAETRSMAMRLQRRGPSDLRDRLHLLPSLILQRLPLSVLEWLPPHHSIEVINRAPHAVVSPS